MSKSSEQSPNGIDINLRQFDMNLLTGSFQPVILIAAQRGAGKSCLVKDILYHFHQAGAPRIVVFSDTEVVNGFFGSFVPAVCVHSPVTIDAIKTVWENQKELAMKKRLNQLPENTNIRLIIVADDLGHNKKLLNNEFFRECLLAGRHYDVVIIITVQYLIDLSVSLRSNVDFAFFLAESNQKNRQRIFDNFCTCFDDIKTFNAVFTTCTEDRGVFVVNRKSAVATLEETINWYKADITREFKFGSPESWQFNKRRFISDEEKFLQQQQQKNQLATAQHDLSKNTRNSIIRITKN
jgi:hypothetical protein